VATVQTRVVTKIDRYINGSSVMRVKSALTVSVCLCHRHCRRIVTPTGHRVYVFHQTLRIPLLCHVAGTGLWRWL